ncbi:hypothetical protein E3P84_04150 [Wallemia ichthyophaga]|nr:hypothetical protein E3P84_04150 [Wallemia ichthyophaga]TIB38032.1 hypothetical protein E3P83_04148 [Wallemia ichthyophaga]
MLMMTEHTEADTAVTATVQQSKYHVRYSTSNKAIAPLHTKSSTGIKGVRPLALKVFDHHILLILAKPILALIPIVSAVKYKPPIEDTAVYMVEQSEQHGGLGLRKKNNVIANNISV